MKTSTACDKVKRTLTPDSDKWLNRAVSKDPVREWLTHVYGNTSSDGFRLHRDTTRPFGPPEGSGVCLDINKLRDSFAVVLDQCKDHNILITINRDALILVCLRAIAIGHGPTKKDDVNPKLRLSVNGRLEYRAVNDEIGETSGYIESGYQHTGPDVEIVLNPHLLIDALSGMDEEVYMALRAQDRPAFITDGKREAVIMPIRLG